MRIQYCIVLSIQYRIVNTTQHPTLYDCTVRLYNTTVQCTAQYSLYTVQNPMEVGLFTYDAGSNARRELYIKERFTNLV